MIVYAGNGLHVYWVLTEQLEPQEWKPLANAMKQAALDKEFKIDAGLTANSALVLRPVGTHNPKNGNEVKLFKDKKDAEEYAIKNHDKLMENMILEFTDAQIKRLKKEYEPLRGKETGMNPEKFKKLRVMMSRMTKDMLLKLVKADLPIIT